MMGEGISEPLAAPQPLLPPRPKQGRALLLVLLIMAFLAALAVLFSRGAERLSDQWTAQLSQSSTAQILISDDKNRDLEVSTTRDILMAALPEARIEVLSRAEGGDLIRPWLGGGDLPPDLPIPGVIRINSPVKLPLDTLQRQFETANLTVILDDHARFSGSLKRTVGRLVLLGTGLVFLIGVAATAVSIFATRAGLAAQRDIVHVLVQAGATDGFVARLFIGQAAKKGLLAAIIGCVLAAIIWVITSMGPAQGSVGWGSLVDGLWDMTILAVLCAAFSLVCAVASGWTVMRQLSDERRRA